MQEILITYRLKFINGKISMPFQKILRRKRQFNYHHFLSAQIHKQSTSTYMYIPNHASQVKGTGCPEINSIMHDSLK